MYFIFLYIYFWLLWVLVAAHRLFIAWLLLLQSTGSRLMDCKVWAQYSWPTGLVACSIAILVLGPGIEPTSPAMAGGFFTTGPPGKSLPLHFKSSLVLLCRYTLLYWVSPYCSSQTLSFVQIEGLWQPCIQQVYWCHFSSSICLLCISVSHVGNSCNISNILLLLCLLWWSVISNLWCYYLQNDCHSDGRIFSNKVFFNKDIYIFKTEYYLIPNRLKYNVNIAFTCTGKLKKKIMWLDLLWYLLYCSGLEPNP